MIPKLGEGRTYDLLRKSRRGMGHAPAPRFRFYARGYPVAIFHLSTKAISRSSGRSAVAAAAYRTGERLTNERDGVTHDYSRRQGVEHTEIVMPDGGDVDRAALWNAAEAVEKRKDARTAREWVLAIPAELVPQDEQVRRLITGSPDRELVREFALELAKRYGVAVDVAIHAPDQEGDRRNHHAHLLATTRQVTRDAAGELVLGDKAALELSDTKRRSLGLCSGADEVAAIRGLWERCANRALEREGRRERIDARSLAAQGVDRAATIHLGPTATAIERAGRPSQRGEQSRAQAAASAEAAESLRLRAEAAQIDAEAERIERVQRSQRVREAWEREVASQRVAVTEQAGRLQARTKAAHAALAERARTHAAAEPKLPGGLLAAFRRGSYERAAKAWQEVMGPLRRRLGQLEGRLELLKAFLPGGRRSEALAEQRAANGKPELAATYRGIVEADRRTQAAAERQGEEQRRQQALEWARAQRQGRGGGRGGRGR